MMIRVEINERENRKNVEKQWNKNLIPWEGQQI